MLEAPKDVKVLEVLKPSGRPNMRERHESSLAKENRLDSAARPVARTGKASDKTSTAQKRKETIERSTPPQKKRRTENAEKDATSSKGSALDEEDEVKEGIDWSDEEKEDESDSGGEEGDSSSTSDDSE